MKLFLFFISLSIFSVEDFKIEYFEPLDLNRNDFLVSIKTNNPSELVEILKGASEKKISIKINNTYTEIYPGSAFQERKDLVEFFCNAYRRIPAGENSVKLSITQNDYEIFLDEKNFIIEDNYNENKQPMIARLSPMGGVIGGTVTIHGKNFGNDLDNIDIYFFDKDYTPSDLEPSEEQPIDYIQMRAKTNPFSITADLDGTQNIHFSIPTSPYLKGLADEAFFRKSIQLRVYVRGRPTAYHKVTILPKDWNLKVILLSLVTTFLGLGIFALMMQKWNFITYILIDKETNTYSLSRFQAFVWTVVLTGSYFYIAIAFGILLQNGKIPDFNPSLIGLMSISYSALITTNFLSRKKTKNEISHHPPQLKDLFMENGIINITRFQLLVFTVVAVIIYLYNLALCNVLNGLPDIPPTLHGLLISSQTGYIGGKILGDKFSVNRITPFEISSTEKNSSLVILGSGFVNGMKIMIEDSENDPVDLVFSSSTYLTCDLPIDGIIGKRNLIFIPPTGSSQVIANSIEIIQVES